MKITNYIIQFFIHMILADNILYSHEMFLNHMYRLYSYSPSILLNTE